jgi:hypothetical protein
LEAIRGMMKVSGQDLKKREFEMREGVREKKKRNTKQKMMVNDEA